MKQEARMRRNEHEDRSVLLYKSITMKIVCPYCEVENPGYQSTCWHCGKDLTGAKRTDNSGHSSSSQGAADLVVVKATTDLTSMPSAANLTPKPASIDPTAKPIIGEWIECPICKVDNSKYQLNCWHCGERLIGVEGIAPDPGASTPIPTTTTWKKRRLPPEKPTSHLQLAFMVGLFFLIILFASIIFQELHTISRIIFIVGIIAGFGYLYVKDLPEASTCTEEGGNSSQSPIPEWLGLLVGIPFMIIILALLLAVMFGVEFLFEFLIDLFITKDGGERILALVLGAGLGVIIELSLGYILRAITHLRSSKNG